MEQYEILDVKFFQKQLPTNSKNVKKLCIICDCVLYLQSNQSKKEVSSLIKKKSNTNEDLSSFHYR
jgi:hypothetical protein